MKKNAKNLLCPCGGFSDAILYKDCCEPYITGSQPAPGAEQLMRSRYSAYTLGDANYILATWHRSTRPAELTLDPPGTAHATRWLGLHIQGGAPSSPTQAQVRFTARYREAGRAHKLTESSRFVLEDGRWYYLDGDIEP